MITRILTKVGASMTVAAYRSTAMRICAGNSFPFQQAIGSLGGASRWGTVSIANGVVTRLK